MTNKLLKNKIENRLKSLKNCSRSQTLNIVIEELKRIGQFRSCIIADENGLFLAENIHKQSNKEDLSAASAIGGEFIERFQDYLKMGNISFSYYVTSSSHIWIKRIFLPHSKETLILFITKDRRIADRLSSSTLKLLKKNTLHLPSLFDTATEFIIKACKD
ncbi:MAG: hypothetical protein ACFFDW_15790 [Candidatus Thorarchaeota archaeon]